MIPSISTVPEVLDQLRIDLVNSLIARGVSVPEKAQTSGGCYEAVLAFQRLSHRSVPIRPRKVSRSEELTARKLDFGTSQMLDEITDEFERGEDMAQRLTRQFYRSSFNDFLYNNFDIHHLHLGKRGSVRDKTKRHAMAGGADALLFAWITPDESFFLDVLNHDVFDNAVLSERLVRIALHARPDFVRKHAAPMAVGAGLSFQTAFGMAKSCFSTGYELDGHVFLTGGTVFDGRIRENGRGPATSIRAVHAANHVLNRVVRLVNFLTDNVEEVGELIGRDGAAQPRKLEIEVTRLGELIVLRERASGAEFIDDGRSRAYRLRGALDFVAL